MRDSVLKSRCEALAGPSRAANVLLSEARTARDRSLRKRPTAAIEARHGRAKPSRVRSWTMAVDQGSPVADVTAIVGRYEEIGSLN